MDTKTNLDLNLRNLFERFPLVQAMPELVGSRNLAEAAELVSGISAPPEVLAGLWLYVDVLDRSHALSQGIQSPTGSYWHAIMHRREGDFSNAKYWYRNAHSHPVFAQIDYDPTAFTDECEQDRGENSPKLVAMQRLEWKTLFDWCMREAGIDWNG